MTVRGRVQRDVGKDLQNFRERRGERGHQDLGRVGVGLGPVTRRQVLEGAGDADRVAGLRPLVESIENEGGEAGLRRAFRVGAALHHQVDGDEGHLVVLDDPDRKAVRELGDARDRRVEGNGRGGRGRLRAEGRVRSSLRLGPGGRRFRPGKAAIGHAGIGRGGSGALRRGRLARAPSEERHDEEQAAHRVAPCSGTTCKVTRASSASHCSAAFCTSAAVTACARAICSLKNPGSRLHISK